MRLIMISSALALVFALGLPQDIPAASVLTGPNVSRGDSFRSPRTVDHRGWQSASGGTRNYRYLHGRDGLASRRPRAHRTVVSSGSRGTHAVTEYYYDSDTRRRYYDSSRRYSSSRFSFGVGYGRGSYGYGGYGSSGYGGYGYGNYAPYRHGYGYGYGSGYGHGSGCCSSGGATVVYPRR